MKNKIYLATTAISEIWDLEKELLLLGPWCYTEKNKKLLEKKKYILIESPWIPFAPKIKKATDYCDDIYEIIFPELAQALNNLHSVLYPEKYWRILLGPWLLHFIGAFYERYIRIRHALELYPCLYTHYLDGDYEISSNDTHDFFNKICGDEYNFKLFSLICTHLEVPGKKIITCPPDVKVPYSLPNPDPLKDFLRRIKKLVEKSIASLSNGPIVLAYMDHLQLQDYLLLSLKTGRFLFHSGKFQNNRMHFEYSPSIRARLTITCSYNDFFIKFLSRFLPSAIPRCCVEGFNFYRKNSPPLSKVKVIGSSVGWYFNEKFKFFAAEGAAKNAFMADFQRGGGGGFGAFYLSAPQKKTAIEKDVFYTWGWDSIPDHGKKMIKLPSPHLSRLKDIYSYSIDKILYIGKELPRYHYRFEQSGLPEEYVRYMEDTRKFLQTLPERLKSFLLYRPYSHNYGWKIRKLVKDVCPQAELLHADNGATGRLTSWMCKVKICIIDHPHTSFIEALSINVPCIFFWDHNVYVMRSEARKYFELLRKGKILYKNPGEATGKLIEIFNDPWSWWNSKEVQEARITFLEHFGYSRKNWMDYWVKEIRQWEK